MSPLATLNESTLGYPLLSLIIFLPVVAAALLAFIRDEEQSRWFSLIILTLTFIFSSIVP